MLCVRDISYRLQGWGQFNSGIGIAAQFQFQFRNWNWNWWNWKWNWNWKPWNWNWNWNWKPELNFLQLLLQQLLVNQPFPNFSFNRGHNLSCDCSCNRCSWDIHCPPVVWSQKIHGHGTLFPLSGQRPEGLKMVTKKYCQATGLDAWASRVKCPARFVSHLHDIYIWVVYSFCLFCCLFIIVTTQFVTLYKPCKPKPSTYDRPLSLLN